MLKKIDSGSERYINNKFEMKIKQFSCNLQNSMEMFILTFVGSSFQI